MTSIYCIDNFIRAVQQEEEKSQPIFVCQVTFSKICMEDRNRVAEEVECMGCKYLMHHFYYENEGGNK